MARRLTEATVNLIINHIQTNIASALAAIETDRGDTLVTLESPKSYFRFAAPKGYRTPAVMVVCNSMKMHNDRGANFIAGTADISVSLLASEITLDKLVTKTWRYQAALHALLHETALTTADTKVKIVSKVEDLREGVEYTEKDDPENVFRKEIALILSVEHWEQL
jgi:hypothetical protein